MRTLRLQLASGKSSRELAADPALRAAAEILRAGGLVAFPTETVYGLGANALDAAAVEKIFAAKQRPHWDPIIVHVAGTEAAHALTSSWPDRAEKLAQAFWPGPLTILLPRSTAIPDVVTAGRAKVGVRLPSHPVAQALIAAAGVPVAAPSANRFGHTSPTTAEHVLADLDGRIDAVLDAGACDVGVESTVIDPTLAPPIIYRPGGVTAEQIRRLLGDVVIAERPLANERGSQVEPAPEGLDSPGLGIRHYAPRARLLLVESERELQEVVEREGRQRRVGVLLPQEWAPPAGAAIVLPWGRWDDPESLARELYRQMRALDEGGVEVIVCPLPQEQGLGLALRDRLRKAAK
jgi:L-threonylcarbamoyladenylate synthase